MNLRIAKSILSETTNIYPAQGSGLRSPRVLQPCVVPRAQPPALHPPSRLWPPFPSDHVCLYILKPLATSAWRLSALSLSLSLSTGNFQNLSDHHFQFHTLPPSIHPRPELIFPSDTSQVGPILIFTPHTHVACVCLCVCVRRLERTFEMRLKTVNSCKGYILRLRVMNAVSAQSQILESVLFD